MGNQKMNKVIYGIAINNRKHPALIGNKTVKEYALWKSMLQRCYCNKYHVKQPTYIGCSVSDNFKSYSYFYDWCQNQIGFFERDTNGRDWHLDKDILVRDNKVYSEDNCVFVPREINAFFNAKINSRGLHPLGVSFNKKTMVFRARCNRYGKSVMLGDFDCSESAHAVYKQFKENLCKELANKWREQIDPRVYDAMMIWEC